MDPYEAMATLCHSAEFGPMLFDTLTPVDLISFMRAFRIKLTKKQMQKYMALWRQIFVDIDWAEKLVKDKCTVSLVGADLAMLVEWIRNPFMDKCSKRVLHIDVLVDPDTCKDWESRDHPEIMGLCPTTATSALMRDSVRLLMKEDVSWAPYVGSCDNTNLPMFVVSVMTKAADLHSRGEDRRIRVDQNLSLAWQSWRHEPPQEVPGVYITGALYFDALDIKGMYTYVQQGISVDMPMLTTTPRDIYENMTALTYREPSNCAAMILARRKQTALFRIGTANFLEQVYTLMYESKHAAWAAS